MTSLEQLRPLFERLEARHGFGLRSDRPPAWVEGRVDRFLREVGAERSLPVEAVVASALDDAPLLERLADLLRVGETRFFRDPAQYRALRAHGFEASRPVRALSVGCATGEEAWSIAMVLAVTSRRGAEVVAIDRCGPALEVARRGVYPRTAVEVVPSELRRRFFLGAGAEEVAVAPELRSTVVFAERDAMRGLPRGFDLVLCENLLIYFGAVARGALVEHLAAALAPGGLLLVARSERALVTSAAVTRTTLAEGVVAFRRPEEERKRP